MRGSVCRTRWCRTTAHRRRCPGRAGKPRNFERLGVHVNADRALVEFRQVDHFVDRLHRIDVCWMGCIHFVNIGGDDFAGAVRDIAVVHAIILHAQPADGHGHPAILIAMIVYPAVLADFPAHRHALEHFIFENKIAGVAAFGKIAIFFQGFGTDSMLQNVVLHVTPG